MTSPTDQELEKVAREQVRKLMATHYVCNKNTDWDATENELTTWLLSASALKQIQPQQELALELRDARELIQDLERRLLDAAVSPQEQIPATPQNASTDVRGVSEDFSDGLRKAVELAEWAWTIIANASGGDWSKETPEWVKAARKYEKQFHEEIRPLLPASYWYRRDLVPPPASTPANPPKEGHSAPVGEISVDDWIKKNESWLTKNGVYTITKFVSEMRGKCVPNIDTQERMREALELLANYRKLRPQWGWPDIQECARAALSDVTEEQTP